MGLWDKISGEFIDIVEWLDDSDDTMVHRFERYGNEIKYGAKLTVRQAQVAVFVNEGQCADVFGPGMYTLETQNLPVLSTLKGWKYGFSSPFKAEVYFVSTKRFTDLKWGTKSPVMIRDPEFGGIRVRAFGSYAMRVKAGDVFLREIAGTDGHFTTDEITDQLRNLIVTRFSRFLSSANIPILDLMGGNEELSAFVTERIGPEFDAYGLELTKLLVENVSLPRAVEQALDKRASMGIIGNLNRYTQYQAAGAIETLAANPGTGGGMASGGMGMGMGFAMANQMAQAMGGQQQPAQQPQQPQRAMAAPPPLPPGVQYFAAINGVQAGPFDIAGLQGRVASGQVTRQTLVWAQGMAGWTKAGEVAALSALFAAAPPPLPPPAPGAPG